MLREKDYSLKTWKATREAVGRGLQWHTVHTEFHESRFLNVYHIDAGGTITLVDKMVTLPNETGPLSETLSLFIKRSHFRGTPVQHRFM